MASAETAPPSTSRWRGRRIVIAPDSFKGSIRAAGAAEAIAEGWRSVHSHDELVRLPMADGGEGTIDALAAAIPGARRMMVHAEGPMGAPVTASWLLLPADGRRSTTGVVELAATSGIEVIPAGEPLRPMDADAIGFGEAIGQALDAGIHRLILAVGGSASSDGGAGVLSALGARVVDTRGQPIPRGARGLEAAAAVDLSRLRPVPAGGAELLTDVNSPLLGDAGAAAIFAPQKGANRQQVDRIERALRRWSALLGGDPHRAGAGGAGGVAFAMMRWGARPSPGADAIAELIGLHRAIAGADLVITGEGSFDAQSAAWKAPSAVLASARRAGVPAAVIAGRIEDVLSAGCRGLSLTTLAGGSARAMAEPIRWLRAAGAALARERARL